MGDEYPYFIGSRASPYRAERIRAEMKKRDKFSIADLKQMHSDVLSSHPRRIIPIVVPILESNANLSKSAKRALAILNSWDYRFDSNSVGASIYDNSLIENTFRDEVGEDLYRRYFLGVGMEEILKGESSWFDDVTTPAVETRRDIILKSFEQAIASLVSQLGLDQALWQWNKIKFVMIDHRTPLSHMEPYNRLFNLGPFNEDGKRGWTINPVNADVYEQIVDLSNIDNSVAMMPPGNSGHIESAHYSDQVDGSGGTIILPSCRKAWFARLQWNIAFITRSNG